LLVLAVFSLPAILVVSDTYWAPFELLNKVAHAEKKKKGKKQRGERERGTASIFAGLGL
jgi:hypothetical protein